MYRDMGFTPVEENGIFTKVLVRTSRDSILSSFPTQIPPSTISSHELILFLSRTHRVTEDARRPNSPTRFVQQRLLLGNVPVGHGVGVSVSLRQRVSRFSVDVFLVCSCSRHVVICTLAGSASATGGQGCCEGTICEGVKRGSRAGIV